MTASPAASRNERNPFKSLIYARSFVWVGASGFP